MTPSRTVRCAAVGEQTGLYRDEVAPRGCTPGYPLEFIRVEVDERGGAPAPHESIGSDGDSHTR